MKVLIVLFVLVLLIFGCKKDDNIAPSEVSNLDSISSDTNAPSEISNLDLISGDTMIILIWSDPIDNDLSQIEVSYENDTIYVPKAIEYLNISNIEIGTNYLFTIKTIDTAGNKSIGIHIQGGIDYRMNYVGDFEFYSYNIDFSYVVEIDSQAMTYLGDITLIENSDSLIQINYRPENNFTRCINGISIQPKVNSKGEISKELVTCEYSKITGQFFGHDSLEIYISLYISEGFGGWAQKIYGKRVN